MAGSTSMMRTSLALLVAVALQSCGGHAPDQARGTPPPAAHHSSAPQDARAQFHTVLALQHSRAQMCRGPENMFWIRLDNSGSHAPARLRYTETDHGVRVGGGPVSVVAPGAISKRAGSTDQFPTTTVAHIRLHHGRALRRGAVELSTVRTC